MMGLAEKVPAGVLMPANALRSEPAVVLVVVPAGVLDAVLAEVAFKVTGRRAEPQGLLRCQLGCRPRCRPRCWSWCQPMRRAGVLVVVPDGVMVVVPGGV